MKLRLYQIDSFASELFAGNPAAVCPLQEWIADELMQCIAAENNLSETAFFVKRGGLYELRWFSPVTEVALCGHATLASAFVIARELGDASEQIRFHTKSGELIVSPSGDQFQMDFPAEAPQSCAVPQNLLTGIGLTPQEVQAATDFLLVYDSQQQIEAISPNYELLRGLPGRGVIVTAPGATVDFVSRWFGPNVGVDEDPVTGSAHCTLTPYWAARLGKTELVAQQLSRRGGELLCSLRGERVLISGKAVKYLAGEIFI